MTSPRNLRADRRGVAAVMFALMLPPLFLATGAAVDFARLGMLKTSLQSVTDGAALAGASALCLTDGIGKARQAATAYFDKETGPISNYASVGAPNISYPSTIEVTVSASATLSNPVMGQLGKMFGNAIGFETVSVTSSAEGPGNPGAESSSYQMEVTRTGGFQSAAADGDSVYSYAVPGDGSLPHPSAMSLLFTNDPSVDPNYRADNADTRQIIVGYDDPIGFALRNVTGAKRYYPHNHYKAPQGSIHWFYSSIAAPSATAYTAPEQGAYELGGLDGNTCRLAAIDWTVNDYVADPAGSTCGAHPCIEMSGSDALQNNLLIAGHCSSPGTASVTCEQVYGNPVSFAWNDMGGRSWDDFGYGDAVYTVTCTRPNAHRTQPREVVLVN